MGTGQRRKIRNYLIDRKVQTRITLMMVVLSSLLTAFLGSFWYAEIRKASAVIRTNAIATIGEEAANSLGQELAAQDQLRLLLLLGFAVVIALLIAAYGIVFSHRIAGPLFKINRLMGEIEAGRLPDLGSLRRGDQLQEFFRTFERMHGALRARVEADLSLLDQLLAGIEGGGDLSQQLPKIREALEDKRRSLQQGAKC
jgi:methyl-accepting chemotaxis protein